MSQTPRFQRVLLKLSGEVLMGQRPFGLDPDRVSTIAEDIASVHHMGVEIVLVIGGGNIFRGVSGVAHGLDRTKSDYMGMLATVMNALALSSAFGSLGVESRVMSALSMRTVCESYIDGKALRHLSKGRIVICAAGTGTPYFTTDTAAALRASEMKCEVLIKGTKVNGIYSDDPAKNPNAQFFPWLSYQDVLEKNLKVMDASAIALAKESQIPIEVFSIREPKAFQKIMNGVGSFTRVGA